MSKLIAVDVDGTLLNSKREINPRTRDALIKAGEMGHKVVIVTGRPTSGTLHLAKELQFDRTGGLLSNYNGGSITDYKSGEIIASHPLDLDLAKEILQFSKDLDLEILIPYEDSVISDKKNQYYHNYEAKILKIKPEVVEDIRESIDFTPNKILFAADEDIIDEPAGKLLNKFGEVTEQVKSSRVYYEVMPKGLSKGASLLEIADHYNIDQKDIIAFGDEMNDVTMLEIAGTSVAMGNAVDEIKQIADHVTETNDDDGIAVYLEKYLF